MAQPVWPLCHLTSLLFLTGPFARLQEVVAEIPAPIETASLIYPSPRVAFAPYLDLFDPFEQVKTGALLTDTFVGHCVTVEGVPLDHMENLMVWTHQKVLERELEAINSLLCGPCDCTLCCTGPGDDALHEFFEIPLTDAECGLFALPRLETPASLSTTARNGEELKVRGAPFYRHPPALYHWANGWSLVLPRGARCPHLGPEGRCAIYSVRPQVCRRPQIFAAVLEMVEDPDTHRPVPGTWARRDSLLAVWDCPYVKALQGDIACYARYNGLEMVFRENKG